MSQTQARKLYFGAETQRRYNRLLYHAKKIYGDEMTSIQKQMAEDYKPFILFLAEFTRHTNLNHIKERDYHNFIAELYAHNNSKTAIRTVLYAAQYWHNKNKASTTIFPVAIAEAWYPGANVDILGP